MEKLTLYQINNLEPRKLIKKSFNCFEIPHLGFDIFVQNFCVLIKVKYFETNNFKC